ncbi:MAG: response regulator receiver protein [Dehalococcoidia bacterium]|nr:response regulator receiver protein [Dehalococcoidia bacterium]
MAEEENKTELLRRVRLFSTFSDEELGELDTLLKLRRFKRGSVVFEQGDPGDALFIVEAGRAKASVFDEAGHEKILAVFGEGDSFGEMSLLTGEARSARVAVVGDAELLTLTKEDFDRFLLSNLGAMRHLLAVMTRRVSEANTMIQHDDTEEQAQVMGKVITIFSPKGGTGKTTLAVNLATILRQEANRAVALVDLSYPFGDVGVMLNLEPRRTMADLIPHINEIDGQLLDSILQQHPSGVKVLLAPPTPEETEMVTAEHVTMVMTILRELYEFIIVDTHSSFSEVSIAALDAADLILVMTTMEMSSLKNVRLFIDTVTTKLDYPREKLALVVNRASPVGGLTVADVQASIGQQAVATISSNGLVAVYAVNQGVPFAISNKESQIYKDIQTLAKLLAPKAMEEQQDLFGDEDVEEIARLTPAERIKAVPALVVAAVKETVAELSLPDVLFGLGNLLIATAPFLFIVTLLGGVSRLLGVGFPASKAYEIAIWVGILGGTYLLVQVRPPSSHAWVYGGIIGGLYGIFILLPTVAVQNISGGGYSFFGIFLAIIFYVILGTLGSLAGERLKRRLQPLLVT